MVKRFSTYLDEFLGAFKGAFPVIVFFMISFGLVYAVFGLHYAIVVSVITVFFRGRYKKGNQQIFYYIRLLVVGSLLIGFAYLASRNLWLCILLNLTIPFILVFTQSSQFNPKGYFSYAMIFVFMELMPPQTLRELNTELAAFAFCVCLMAAAIWIYGRLFAGTAGRAFFLPRVLGELSELILLLPDPGRKEELEERFGGLLREFHRMSYHQNFFAVQTREKQLYDMASTIIQRFSYLITDHEWQEELDRKHIHCLKQVSSCLQKTAENMEAGLSLTEQLNEVRRLLRRMSLPEGRVRVFCRSILHMTELMIKNLSPVPQSARVVGRRSIRETLSHIRLRLSSESFEIRFAMRLSMVMTVTCAISHLLPVTHAYWIPLNAFLLLQPSGEDSSYRMKTRPIGTMIGCCIEFLIHPLLPGVGSQLIFALVMISLMYCAAPGTWYQPIFSTCYALTLTSMTLDRNTAITLRIVYLGAAVAVVFLINRFFFPMGKESQFKYNLKGLFRLNNSYWDIIRLGLYQTTDLSISCELLTYFHTLYEECAGYLNKNKSVPNGNELKTVLLTLWHMFSELEQMHYLVRTNRVGPLEKQSLLRLIGAIQEELYPIISAEKLPDRKNLPYRDKEVVHVLSQYIKHAEELLQYKACIPF